ncbi:ankyrin repeat domain-containing protein [Aporhodopirellula aestuarii]|uniref:Ankyrin repeat domain-containing protein n=1 Tax=Aporhodopirellula aestuarii TaxID=2950107 RepID=A0ABT0UCZ9_9BACT|nr:ankyrin repeat domain-containing protein [Aporhodopirellula aestuarii]MCM2374731.1 ankyrin repeat domain-containing protein [Aporhodopirellula aestuarii]
MFERDHSAITRAVATQPARTRLGMAGVVRIASVLSCVGVVGWIVAPVCEAAAPNLSLVEAVEREDWATSESLLKTRAESDERAHESLVNQARGDGMTPLHWAVHHDNDEWVQRLLDEGADPNAVTYFEITPLSIACRIGNLETATSLLQHGAKVDMRGPGKTTPLMLAARTGEAELCRLLIEHGAEVEATERAGQTPLMFAAAEGHVDVINALLDAGADLNRTLRSGFSPLCFAARQGHIAASMTLLDRGASVNEMMDPKNTSGRNARKGMTPLMLAVESAHYELAMKFVERGADPNDESSEYAPLHVLCWVRRPQKGDNPAGDPAPRGSGNLTSLDFVRAIVDAGADVNLQLRRGKAAKGLIVPRGATPFLLAAQRVDLPFMELLLELGADPHLTNVDGVNALMAAAGVGTDHVGEHEGTPEEVEQAVRMLVAQGLDINAVSRTNETAMHGAAYRCFPETVRLVAQLGAKPETWNHKNKFGWTPLDIAKGYRPGSFKPDPATIAAITELLGND